MSAHIESLNANKIPSKLPFPEEQPKELRLHAFDRQSCHRTKTILLRRLHRVLRDLAVDLVLLPTRHNRQRVKPGLRQIVKTTTQEKVLQLRLAQGQTPSPLTKKVNS